MPEYTRSGTRRAGDDYQDAVALDLLVEFLEHPERYQWIKVEADSLGVLDDVCALTADGRLILKQVKFSTDPANPDSTLDWEELLQTREGQRGVLPSLLQRLADSLRRAKNLGPIAEAALHTNRRGSAALVAAIDHSGLVKIANVGGAERKEIIQQLGGEAEAAEFFQNFKFELDRPSLESLEEGVRKRFARLSGSELGWLNLKDQLRRWVKFKNEPLPDGCIALNYIKRAANWHVLQPLPQGFEIPADYVPPEAFHKRILEVISGGSQANVIVSGRPGVGKSTYLSYLCDQLKEPDGFVVVRHHYFLSMTDPYERFDHRRVAESLMSQLEMFNPGALGETGHQNPDPDRLREWVTACGKSLSEENKRLVLIVDGLDHVWRESGATRELDELFNQLLPAPPGTVLIVGTQPIAEQYLPKRLVNAVARDLWQELPNLEGAAVRKWVEIHAADFELPQDSDARRATLNLLAGAFLKKTEGHPLHLRYTLRALQERNIRITEENIASLPACPHGDINEYYRLLWGGLSEKGRQILHLLAASDFRWPTIGILDCLAHSTSERPDVKNALTEVAHLLHHDGFGWIAFHASIFPYVRGLPEHGQEETYLREAALDWLRTTASEYWRWAYEWLLEEKNGRSHSLIMGPSRDWTIDAIARWRSPFEVVQILERAATAALCEQQLARFVELGLFRDYYSRTNDYYADVTGSLRYCQLRLSEDDSLVPRLLSNLEPLKPDELLLLSEYAKDHLSPSTLAKCVVALNQWPEKRELDRRVRVSGEEQAWRTIMAELGAVATIEIPRVLWFLQHAEQFRTGYQHKDELFSIFAESLWRHRSVGRLQELSSTDLPSGQAEETQHNLARCACEEEFDAERFLKRAGEHVEGMLTCYVLLRAGQEKGPWPQSSFPMSLLRLKDYDVSLRYRYEVDRLFRDVFFDTLAFYLKLDFDATDLWLNKLEDEQSWAGQFLRSLVEIAIECAKRLKCGNRPNWEWFFSMISGVALPEPNESREDWEYSQRAMVALIDIAFDLHLLANASLGQQRLTPRDFKAAVDSRFAPRESLMERYFQRRGLLFDEDAVSLMLDEEARALDATIEDFPDRAKIYALMANIAAMHRKTSDAQTYSRKAASNLLAYSHHKDMLLFRVLDAIRACYSADQSWQDESRRRLFRVARLIGSILEFTDHDETRHLITELGGALVEMSPDLIPDYYKYLCDERYYPYAADVFRTVLERIVLTDPFARALADTATDRETLLSLKERAEKGDKTARDCVEIARAFFGDVQKDSAAHSGSTRHTMPEDEALNVGDFSPDKLDALLSACRSIGDRRGRNAVAWLDFWDTNGRGAEALAAMESAIARGESFDTFSGVLDRMASLAVEHRGKSAAYDWFVKAHVDSNGWAAYFTDTRAAEQRLNQVVQLFPNKWFDFIRDTVSEALASGWRSSSVWGEFLTLVRFCIAAKQIDVANAITEKALQFVEALCSPAPLPRPNWIPSETE